MIGKYFPIFLEINIIELDSHEFDSHEFLRLQLLLLFILKLLIWWISSCDFIGWDLKINLLYLYA